MVLYTYSSNIVKIKEEKQMKKEKQNTNEFLDNIEEVYIELQKARFAVSEIINEFDVSYELSPYKAAAYGSSVDASEKYKDDPSYYYSWKYCSEYEKLMWLANIILDYTYLANERLENILEKDN